MHLFITPGKVLYVPQRDRAQVCLGAGALGTKSSVNCTTCAGWRYLVARNRSRLNPLGVDSRSATRTHRTSKALRAALQPFTLSRFPRCSKLASRCLDRAALYRSAAWRLRPLPLLMYCDARAPGDGVGHAFPGAHDVAHSQDSWNGSGRMRSNLVSAEQSAARLTRNAELPSQTDHGPPITQ